MLLFQGKSEIKGITSNIRAHQPLPSSFETGDDTLTYLLTIPYCEEPVVCIIN